MARGDSPAISTRVWFAAFCIDGVENRGSRDEAEALKRLQAKQKPKHASDARFRRVRHVESTTDLRSRNSVNCSAMK